MSISQLTIIILQQILAQDAKKAGVTIVSVILRVITMRIRGKRAENNF